MTRTTIPLVFIFAVSLSCCSGLPSPDIKEMYQSLKDKDLSSFQNWYIYPRNSDNQYVFDYLRNDSLIERYYLVSDDSIWYRRIFPVNGTLPTISIASNLPELRQQNIISLYERFKRLNVNALYSRDNDSIIILHKEDFFILHTFSANTDVSRLSGLKEYKMIEPRWYYYEK